MAQKKHSVSVIIRAFAEAGRRFKEVGTVHFSSQVVRRFFKKESTEKEVS